MSPSHFQDVKKTVVGYIGVLEPPYVNLPEMLRFFCPFGTKFLACRERAEGNSPKN